MQIEIKGHKIEYFVEKIGMIPARYESLSSFRKHKADAITNPAVKAQSISAGYLLESKLAERGVYPDVNCHYVTGEFGKPELEPYSVPDEGSSGAVESEDIMLPYFSIAHTRSYAAVAIADVPVGIDIEEIMGDETWQKRRRLLDSRYFSDEERRSCLTSENEQETFLMLWTQKEAYAKCHGLSVEQVLLDHTVIDEAGTFSTADGGYVLSVYA